MDEFTEIAKILSSVLKDIFVNPPSVSIETDECTEDLREMLLVDGNGLVVRIEDGVEETITGTIPVKVFVVEKTIIIHNYPHEPDDAGFKEVGRFTHRDAVIIKICELYAAEIADTHLEFFAMEEVYGGGDDPAS